MVAGPNSALRLNPFVFGEAERHGDSLVQSRQTRATRESRGSRRSRPRAPASRGLCFGEWKGVAQCWDAGPPIAGLTTRTILDVLADLEALGFISGDRRLGHATEWKLHLEGAPSPARPEGPTQDNSSGVEDMPPVKILQGDPEIYAEDP